MLRLRKHRWLLGTAVPCVLAIVALVAVRVSRPAVTDTGGRPILEFSSRDLVTLSTQRLTVELALPGTVQAVSQATVRSKVSAVPVVGDAIAVVTATLLPSAVVGIPAL